MTTRLPWLAAAATRCFVVAASTLLPLSASAVTVSSLADCQAKFGAGSQEIGGAGLVACEDFGMTVVGSTVLSTRAAAAATSLGDAASVNALITNGGQAEASVALSTSVFLAAIAPLPVFTASVPLLVELPFGLSTAVSPASQANGGEARAGIVQLFLDGRASGSRQEVVAIFDGQNPISATALDFSFDWSLSPNLGPEARISLVLLCAAFAPDGSDSDCDASGNLPRLRFDQATFDQRMGANTFPLAGTFVILVPEPGIGALLALSALAWRRGGRGRARTRP